MRRRHCTTAGTPSGFTVTVDDAEHELPVQYLCAYAVVTADEAATDSDLVLGMHALLAVWGRSDLVKEWVPLDAEGFLLAACAHSLTDTGTVASVCEFMARTPFSAPAAGLDACDNDPVPFATDVFQHMFTNYTEPAASLQEHSVLLTQCARQYCRGVAAQLIRGAGNPTLAALARRLPPETVGAVAADLVSPYGSSLPRTVQSSPPPSATATI